MRSDRSSLRRPTQSLAPRIASVSEPLLPPPGRPRDQDRRAGAAESAAHVDVPFKKPQRFLHRVVPVSEELLGYRAHTARRDIGAGLTVAALALPAAMAYAEVAALSQVRGLYALLLPTVAYAVLGSSNQLIIGRNMVEALTIVLGIGVVRGWRSPLVGVAAAAVLLAALIAAVGPALRLLPIDLLRLVVGALLLGLGLQWLRKAILRASGYKALRDETAAFRRRREEAAVASADERAGLDSYAFTIAFKGVLLEGLEVAFIVVSFGRGQGRLGLVATAAATALVAVAGVGVLVRSPLTRVPQNTIKFAVGLLLTTSVASRRSREPGCIGREQSSPCSASWASSPRFASSSCACCGVSAWLLSRSEHEPRSRDWQPTFGVLLALASTLLLRHTGLPAWWLVPAAGRGAACSVSATRHSGA
jgi:uncharacterized membrane protein